ncbi:hypothetical protein LW135_03525 [Helicobacter sp. faydin-H20]|uniref:hypothetical protein n=1 Tax=Helicobacter anatolicus TaxID=2905874 RepID=UPI001E33F76E|nr:hypothetical protein [Helicobacter anatolicus]MCE3036901.1 hypothetical protein [Helicobacter anatolicus]
MRIAKIKTTFVAFSLASIFCPILSAEQSSIDNSSDPKKVVTIGTPTMSDKLNGHISTTGSGNNTTVIFRGSSSMEGGYIYVDSNATGSGNGGGNSGAASSNTIILQENSFLKLTKQTATATKAEDKTTIKINSTTPTARAAAKKEEKAQEQETKNIDFSILAVGNATNNINDLTTNTATNNQGNIASNIVALDKGKNIITNLRNTTIEGSLISEDGGSNTLSIDIGSNLKGYMSATKGGSNILNVNRTAMLNMETTQESEAASIFADGENSSNTIQGSATNKATISGAVFASNKAKNTITLSSADIKGHIKAQDGGSNSVVLKDGSIASVVTQGEGANNSITLQGNARLTGYIANLETTQGEQGQIPSKSENNIVLNGTSMLNLKANAMNGNKQDINASNAAISSIGEGNKNIITGNTTAENTITNDIFANKKGSNTIFLSNVTINSGDIIADGGSNTLNLDNLNLTGNVSAKNEGINNLTIKNLTMTGSVTADSRGQNLLTIGNSTTQSTITGDITATGSKNATSQENQEVGEEEKDSSNVINFNNVAMIGKIAATKGGKNNITLIGSTITGDITATDNGQNTIIIGNASRSSMIKTNGGQSGKIEAGANGKNTILFNSGDVEGGIIANGTGAQNTITLGNEKYTGQIKANISSVSGGENDITIAVMDMTGNITANTQGTNTIKDSFPVAGQSRMEGGIYAKDGGNNTITLQNIAITQGINAEGDRSKNTITLGNGSINKNGIITSDITATTQGNNTITFGKNASLIGSINAKNGGTNTITEDNAKTTSFEVTGKILADNGTNAITLANAQIRDGILAQNKGKNELKISSAHQDYKLQSNIVADTGGSNTITIGGEKPPAQMQNNGTFGNLLGNILAKGDQSSNEITLNNSGFLKGNLWSDTKNETNVLQKNHNTITLNDDSHLELVVLDENNPYAVYASGNGANNTIKDNATNSTQSVIKGGITADNIKKDSLNDVAMNNIHLKNLSLHGDITAFNAGQNQITFLQAQMQGNINADTKGKNLIIMDESSKVNINGNVTATEGGDNTLTLKNNANLQIASDNNDKSFQAIGEGSKNTLSEDRGVMDSSGLVQGHIFAKDQGENTINVRKINIIGDAITQGGSNTITIGGKNSTKADADIAADMQGSLIANSGYNAGMIEDSTNTLVLNGAALFHDGQLLAQHTSVQEKAHNKITINDNAAISLKGKQVYDNEGSKQGSGNDAIFSDSLQAYNEITDNSMGKKVQNITGNIYAKNNTINDTSIQSGNKVQLQNANIAGSIIADDSGINTIALGNQKQSDNQASMSILIGNVIANQMGKNALTLHNTSMNDGANVYGISAKANENVLETSNTLTFGGNSRIANTYLSAIQEGGKNDITKEVVNTLTLKDNTSMHLVANREDNRAVYTSGYNAKNKIDDMSTGDKKITGSIVANDMGANDFNFKKITINEGGTIYGIEATGKESSVTETKNTIVLNDNSSIFNTYVLATQEGDGDAAETSNTITLNDTSIINLKANHDENAITADGKKTKNTIADTSTSTTPAPVAKEDEAIKGHSIVGNIYANKSGQNVVTLKNLTMQGSILANETGQNTLVFTDSSLNVSPIKQGIISSVNANEDFDTTNSLTLNGSSSLSNTYLKAYQQAQTDSEKKIKTAGNTIILNGSSTLNLVAGEVTEQGLDGEEKAAILAYGVWAKNTITDNTTTSQHVITGDIKANFNATNEITLNKVTMRGDIIAESAANNKITFGKEKDSGSFDGDIIAITKYSASKNEVIFNGMQIGGAEINKIYNENGGNNAITLDKGSTLNNMYMHAQKRTSENKITLADTESILHLNTNPETQFAMFASQDTAKNIIEGMDTNEKDHSIQGALQAQNNASNSVTLNKLTLTGNMVADTEGSNTITIKKSGIVKGDIFALGGGKNTLILKETMIDSKSISAENPKSNNAITMDGNSSLIVQNETQNAIFADEGSNDIKQGATTGENSIIGDILAQNKGKNTITLDNLKMKGNVLVNTGGSNTLSFGMDNKQSTLEGDIRSTGGKNEITINHGAIKGGILATGNETDNLKSSNMIYLNTAKLEDSYLFAKTEGEAGKFEARNRVDLKGDSSVIFRDYEGNAILASGKNSGNLVNDLTMGANTSIISSNILAENEGTNTLSLKNVNVTGDVLALNKGSNSLEFGKSNGQNTLQGNLYADAGENKVTLTSFSMTGSMIVLSDDSKNTLTLRSGSTMTGYMQAISEETGASNTLTINDTSTIMLKGASLRDKNNQSVGTGNDAIYTQGANSKNIIQDNSVNGAFNTISGNVTAVSGGQNSYNFKKLQMQGSLYALKENTSNTITISDESYIRDGLIRAEGNGVSNTITLDSSAKIQNMYLEANAQEGNASNSLTLNGTSTMNLSGSAVAVSARGEGSSNMIAGASSGSHEILGDIFADAGNNKIDLTGNLTLTGNINSQNNGSNTISINKGTFTGNIVALGGGKNTLTAAKETEPKLETYNTSILAEGGESINTLTLGGASVLDGRTLTARAGGKNSLTFEETSNFTFQGEQYALLAEGKNSLNHIIGPTGKIVGNILAKSGGVNELRQAQSLNIASGYISSIGEGSQNNILANLVNGNVIIIANSNDGNAILAQDGGSNNIEINNINRNDLDSITGNITAKNAGVNSITYGGNFQLDITGSVIAEGEGSKNTLNLNSQSKLHSGYLDAKSGGVNTLIFGGKANFALKHQNGDYAILADGEGSKNDLQSEKQSSVTGNIIAKNGGSNDLSKVKKLTLMDGYISAVGEGSSNTIISDLSSFKLIKNANDNNAILADGGNNIFTLSSTDSSNGNEMSITGDITAKNEGSNTLSYTGTKELGITGSIHAFGGKNTLMFNSTSKISQGVLESTNGGGNTITFSNGGNFEFIGDKFAILADGEGSTNTITSTTQSSITGNILALNGGINDLSKVENVDIKNGYIVASGEGGKNIITPKTASFVLHANPKDNNAILADNSGGNTITLSNMMQQNGGYSITGNISALNSGNNSLQSEATMQIQGSIIAEGDESKNMLDLKGNSKISNGFLRATNDGNNTITLSEGSSFDFSGAEYALLADHGKNIITNPNMGNGSVANTITGNIIAKNGGSNDLSNVASLKISQASIIAQGMQAKNLIKPTQNNSKIELIANDNNAILADNGSNDISLKGNFHSIAGAIVAKNNGQNILIFEDTNSGKVVINGDIISSGTDSKNTLTLGGASSITGAISTINAENSITLNNTASFAIKSILADGGKNTLVNDTTTNNNGTNQITLSIIAKNGGSNDFAKIKNYEISKAYISALGNNANNTIVSNEMNNKINLIANTDNNAILASNGSNTLNLTAGTHTITGNITAKNGSNTINFGVQDGASVVKENGGNIVITGGFEAQGTGKNTIIINSKDSKITQSFLKVQSAGATNEIKLMGGASFALINYEESYAMYADGGVNNIVNETGEDAAMAAANTIAGNIIAKNGGKNNLDKVAKFTLIEGYISASSNGSKNTLIVQNGSSISLVSDSNKNAVFANGGENSITAGVNISDGVDGVLDIAMVQKIAGNITAQNSGINQITLKKLEIKGDINSSTQGKNTLMLSSSGGVLNGAFRATSGGVNTLEFSNQAKIDLKNNSGDGYAVFASGASTSNTITDKNTNGNVANTINGNIAAFSQAINTLSVNNVTFEGNIIARGGGVNKITFTKGLSQNNHEIFADGKDSQNILSYTDYETHGLRVESANNGNNVISLALGAAKVNASSVGDAFDLTISTSDTSKNIIVVQGISNGATNKIYYTGGVTEVLLSTQKATNQADITNGLNPSNYNNGVMLSLDSAKANDVLGDFREYSAFVTNIASVKMKDENVYVVGGNYVGSFNVLNMKSKARVGGSGDVGISIDKHSSFNADLTNQSATYHINLDESSKWFVNRSTKINLLSATNTKVYSEDMGSTLLQNNTIVDMVSGGYSAKRGFSKEDKDLVKLTLDNVKSLDHVIFRGFATLNRKKADFIDVNKADSNAGSARLQTYYDDESLENAGSYSYQVNNRANNILVATVEKDAKNNFSFDTTKKSIVEQGYLLVETEYIKVREDKEPKPKPPEGEEETPTPESDLVDNYYIGSYTAKINPNESARTTSLLSSLYLVYLSHVDSLNKRMGELRDNVYDNNLWVRSFVGQSSQNKDLKNIFVNAQVGYDYGFGFEESMHYIGFSAGYGYNNLKSSLLQANSNLIEASMYYVYVGDTGFYSDTTLKYNMITLSPKNSDVQNSLMAHAFNLGEEFGYRVHFGDTRAFYLDTNMSFIAGAMTKIDLLQKTDEKIQTQMHSQSDLAILLRGGVGMTFGYSLKTSKNQTDFRVGASYIGDYILGKVQLDVGNIAKEEHKFGYNQMVVMSFGINSYLTKNLRLYFEGQAGFMGKVVNQDFLANIGLRYSFGNEKRDYPNYAMTFDLTSDKVSNNNEDEDE